MARPFLDFAPVGLALLLFACGSGGGSGFNPDPGQPGGNNMSGGPDASLGDDGSPSLGGPSDAKPPGCTTTVSGTVYDPAGKNPLYDIVVYVPGKPPDPFKSGATCDSCSDLYTGAPVASALTDASGKFTMAGVPAGSNVPLVIQVGKWRKQTKIATVTACQDNPLPDKSLTLPKNHGEGDIPNIAIATGEADSLECLLRRIGLDAAEYGGGASGAGRIHIFQGAGAFAGPGPNTSPPGPDPFQALWDSDADILQYDIVLLSCFGDEPGPLLVGLTQANQQVLFDYAAAGGRVFASHFHYAWFDSGPFGAANLASWSKGANGIGAINAKIVTTLANGQPFPKGQAMKDWLTNVGALMNGELPIVDAKHNADVSAGNAASQPWIVADTGPTQYFSFDTPLNATPDKQCGRVVFSDLHVGAASGDYGGSPGNATTPSGCANNDLTPQEKALEFMLFDLSSCVTPNNVPPQPPPVMNK